MPYKAIKTDDGVKVVEIKGTPPDMEAYYCQDGNGSEFDVGAWEDAMEDFNSEPKQYPTLPTDKWELDRVYRDDEVRIAQDYKWNAGNYSNRCSCCQRQFMGAKLQYVCEPCCNTQYAVPNIQEDDTEYDTFKTVIRFIRSNPKASPYELFFNLRNNYSIKRK